MFYSVICESNLLQYKHLGVYPINRIDRWGLSESDAGGTTYTYRPNWGLVRDGLVGMGEATAQIVFGVGITQVDSPLPGPMDVIGAGIVVKGFADLTLGYGKVVSGLLGNEESEIPSDIVNATAAAITGSDEIGDAVEEVVDYVIGNIK